MVSVTSAKPGQLKFSLVGNEDERSAPGKIGYRHACWLVLTNASQQCHYCKPEAETPARRELHIPFAVSEMAECHIRSCVSFEHMKEKYYPLFKFQTLPLSCQ